MRLKLKVGLSGSAFCLRPGDEHDFDDAEAVRLIQADIAIPVAVEPERAVPMNAVERRKKAGRV